MGTHNIKRWNEEELVELKHFFNKKRTAEEKKEISKKLGRTFRAIYNKYLTSIKEPSNTKTSAIVRRKKDDINSNSDITVTHVSKKVFKAALNGTENNSLSNYAFSIRIGEVIVETQSPRIKINDISVEI